MLCPTSLPQKDTDPSSCFRLCNFAFVRRSIFALFLCALFSPFFLPFRAVFAFLYAVFAFWVLPPCCSRLCRLSLVRCSRLFGPSCVLPFWALLCALFLPLWSFLCAFFAFVVLPVVAAAAFLVLSWCAVSGFWFFLGLFSPLWSFLRAVLTFVILPWCAVLFFLVVSLYPVLIFFFLCLLSPPLCFLSFQKHCNLHLLFGHFLLVTKQNNYAANTPVRRRF